jgi:hypothetical protein
MTGTLSYIHEFHICVELMIKLMGLEFHEADKRYRNKDAAIVIVKRQSWRRSESTRE